jgi:geranylgeranyl reductase family protein
MDLHDVIIVGAGPAGSAVAYLLSLQGRRVLLLDKNAFPRDKTCGDCLSPGSLRALRAMGLLEPVLAIGWRIHRALALAPNGHAISAPVQADGDLPDFALVVPRLQLDDLLRRQAVDAGGEFRTLHVTGLLRAGDEVLGVSANGPEGPLDLRARLVVLATGASTALLEHAGMLAASPVFDRAARTYYDGVSGLSDMIEAYFLSEVLPGYGWVFPTSATAANVGAVSYGRDGKRSRTLPRQILERLLITPTIVSRLDGAHAMAPCRGYPLRADFPAAQSPWPALVLVGEACGLVNPLTGEGIEYALESAEAAADIFGTVLRRGEAPGPAARKYNQVLRHRYLRPFANGRKVRKLISSEWVVNRLIAAASRSEALRALLLHIVLGSLDPGRLLRLRTVLQVALG